MATIIDEQLQTEGQRLITFTTVKGANGWLGNMAAFPLVHDYGGCTHWRTSEALFQALRFAPDHPVIKTINTQRSPMAAALIARKHRSEALIERCGYQDIDNMLKVLSFKVNQHDDVRQQLLATGSALIIEDCTRRKASPWGAQLRADGRWYGQNLLGACWADVRTNERLIDLIDHSDCNDYANAVADVLIGFSDIPVESVSYSGAITANQFELHVTFRRHDSIAGAMSRSFAYSVDRACWLLMAVRDLDVAWHGFSDAMS